MAKRDCYQILGIERGADEKAIKRAYRKLAKKYHPDQNPGDKNAEQKFKEISEAYDILSDPDKKKLYDQYGYAAFSEGFDPNQTWNRGYTNHDFGKDGFYREFHYSSDGNNTGDFSDMFGDIFGEFFNQTGGSGGRTYSGYHEESYGNHRQFKTKGVDVESVLTIQLEDVMMGSDKDMLLQDENGQKTKLRVHIPKGIKEGQTIRLKGKGGPGMNGGPNGDVLLKVKIAKKRGFEREDNDLYVTANIPYATAVLGGEATVAVLDGKVSLRIPEGTQSGSKLRLRGKGFPFRNNHAKRGDCYVVIQIEVPKNLNEEEKRMLRAYAQACRRPA